MLRSSILYFSGIHEEEKVCLKEVYSAFYHQLVDAISDEQVCESLSAQLRSSAVIPEEKISQLISSRASGSSFLNILGVEEQSGLVAVLIKSMSAVEQLQTLASEMNDMLSSKQSTLNDFYITCLPCVFACHPCIILFIINFRSSYYQGHGGASTYREKRL